jgi:hypothetical protein
MNRTATLLCLTRINLLLESSEMDLGILLDIFRLGLEL